MKLTQQFIFHYLIHVYSTNTLYLQHTDEVRKDRREKEL